MWGYIRDIIWLVRLYDNIQLTASIVFDALQWSSVDVPDDGIFARSVPNLQNFVSLGIHFCLYVLSLSVITVVSL